MAMWLSMLAVFVTLIMSVRTDLPFWVPILFFINIFVANHHRMVARRRENKAKSDGTSKRSPD
jgi:hypothetical protein